MNNPLISLGEHGQAVWLDYIRRDLLTDGGLEQMVEEDGLTGVTSNPAIFAKAISGSDLYDRDILEFQKASPDASINALYEHLAVTDIRLAADILRTVYDRTEGADGFVSLEVSPHLADDTDGTIEEAHRLKRAVDRPNVMIKVPATDAGIPAIRNLIAAGVNVNVTLMFSLADYEAVARAYLAGVADNPNPAAVASVASFFVSRVDSKVDAQLERIGSDEALALRGRVAVANSKLVYRRYQELFESPDFTRMRQEGVRPQRPLWASTSTKNPDYSDVLYVETLIGPETVNTLPPATLEAFRDHGRVERTVDQAVGEAEGILETLKRLGVNLDQITDDLQREGVEKFAQPFDDLLAALEQERELLVAAG